MLNLTSGRSYIHMTLNFGNILKWETIDRTCSHSDINYSSENNGLFFHHIN